MKSDKCYICGSGDFKKVYSFDKRPSREIDLGIGPRAYSRKIEQCRGCGAYNNFHNYDFEELYAGKYNSRAYSGSIESRFREIMSLPLGQSINKQRVNRIVDFCARQKLNPQELSVLDVGSGLCVFLAEFLKHGIEAHCVDPDAAAIEHARRNVKPKGAFKGSFMDYRRREKFDIITFNKVLEHATNPTALLKKAAGLLKQKGFIYIELPDGEGALMHGMIEEREEFFIDHYTVFTQKSLRFMNISAGLRALETKNIIEPGDKYTLYAFVKPEFNSASEEIRYGKDIS